MEMVGVQIWVH